MKLVPVPLGEPPAPPMRLRSMLPGVPECRRDGSRTSPSTSDSYRGDGTPHAPSSSGKGAG
eukprot:4265939-Prymnesium_polylepis.1